MTESVAFPVSGAFPADATTTMVAEGRIASSTFVADMAALAAFAAP